jgi:alanine racemase
VLRALARVDLAAIERNVARLARHVGSSTMVCAVVKADGYGHGAVPAARAAQAGGARWLAVAAAQEARELRDAGISGRILVMGALSDEELAVALAADADVVVWHERYVDQVAAGGGGRVHVKLDTGMGRLGTRDPGEADRTADAAAAASGVELAGAMTHFATADERGDSFMGEQLGRFLHWARPLRERHPGLTLHAANSAATLRDADTHLDMVRSGIAIYGMDPFHEDPAERDLEPALELLSYVAEVKACAPGETVGYGRRFTAREQTEIATIPIGYGDGVRRGLTNNADVLIGGRRFPVAGTVSMDNITVELGPDSGVRRGERAVLIGAADGERILAEQVAARLGTINYEVTCGITARVPREHVWDGGPGSPATWPAAPPPGDGTTA